MLHHGLVACPVLPGKPVVEESVDGQHVGRPDSVGVTVPRSVAHHYPDGIGLVGGTAAKEVQNGLRLRADCGPALSLFCSLFAES